MPSSPNIVVRQTPRTIPSHDWIDLRLYAAVQRAIWRNGAFSKSQCLILRMIADRTIAQKRLWEVVTVDQFTRGIYRRDANGEIICVDGGTGLSQIVLMRELKGLLAAGVVRRRLHDKSHNLFAYGLNLTAMMKKHSRLPKRLRLLIDADTLPPPVEQVAENGFSVPDGFSEGEAQAIIQNMMRADAESGIAPD